jgi:hypothetical protein
LFTHELGGKVSHAPGVTHTSRQLPELVLEALVLLLVALVLLVLDALVLLLLLVVLVLPVLDALVLLLLVVLVLPLPVVPEALVLIPVVAPPMPVVVPPVPVLVPLPPAPPVPAGSGAPMPKIALHPPASARAAQSAPAKAQDRCDRIIRSSLSRPASPRPSSRCRGWPSPGAARRLPAP